MKKLLIVFACSAVLLPRGAAQPETNPPTDFIASEIELFASDAMPGDFFGSTISISGDTLVAGSLREGLPAVYVFARNGETWVQEAKLTGADAGIAPAEFGWETAISGERIVVGAPAYGAAYVFVRNGGAWSKEATLTPATPNPGEQFGISVAISGGTAIVGAPPAAYIFRKSGAAWVEEAQLVSPIVPAAGDFGRVVAVSGNTAVVGAPGAVGSGLDPGAAHVFVRSGSTWSVQANLEPEPHFFLPFGGAVDISSERVVVGSCCGRFDEGVAYVFARSGNTWSREGILHPTLSFPSFFGRSAAISGNITLVGAPLVRNVNGAAYVFFRSDEAWNRIELFPSDSQDGDQFGKAVAISGTTFVVGAPNDDHAGANAGSIYVFELATAPALSVSFDLPTRIVTLTWVAEPGKSYTIRSSSDLESWTDLASGLTTGEFSEPAPLAGEKFYRLTKE